MILAPPQIQAPQPLLLSSESKTGIKIPSGQIAGGAFTVASGETKDLNINFDTCASIVVQGNGQFRLKPVLHAGEVALTRRFRSMAVLVDKATNAAIVGGKGDRGPGAEGRQRRGPRDHAGNTGQHGRV